MQIRQLSVGITFISEFEKSEQSYLRGIEQTHSFPILSKHRSNHGHEIHHNEDLHRKAIRESTRKSMVSEWPDDPQLLEMQIKTNLQRSWQHVEGETNFFKIPFAIPRRRAVDSDAVTIAVHSDTARFNRLLFLIQRWNGPVSASIYLKSREDVQKLAHFVATHQDALAWTDIHILLESIEADYPHNLLREMALRSIESEYFLAMDVDFVTTPDAYSDLHQLIRRDDNLRAALHNRTWMVLPAFDRIMMDVIVGEDNILTIEETYKNVLPRNKKEALELWDKDNLDPFHLERVSWGHGPTNYDAWYVEPEFRKQLHEKNTKPSFYPISYEIGFEPYVLGCKCNDSVVLPKYWPGFRGFGYNKYTFFVLAHYMGFQFAVLQDYFVVHLPHRYGKRRVKPETEYELKQFTKYMKNNFNLTEAELDDI